MKAFPKIFLDSGDPAESKRVKELLGNLDGQTTNPTLVSKHPVAQRHLADGKKFTEEELLKFYREVVSEIEKETSGPISVEVYADWDTPAQTMLDQARNMFTWGKNIHIKFPTIPQGLNAAHQFLAEGGRINMTLVFDQTQAAAVYALQNYSSSSSTNEWRESRDPNSAQALTSTDGKGRATGPADKKNPAVFVSPFMGRWDDRNKNGLDLLKNIIQMYGTFPSPTPLVLASSIRNLDHFLGSISLGADLLTVPLKIIEEWAQKSKSLPEPNINLNPKQLDPIDFQEIPVKEFDQYKIEKVEGDLLDEGLQKFTKDWNSLLQ